MRRYSFGTFRVDDFNRQAFEICRRVGDLEAVGRLPVLVLGERGSGKTHLLYSIVNRLRAASKKAGLAYVTARDFPDQVRALLDDPTPVRRTRSAILLVDQLEQFEDLVEELEAIVQLFLTQGHYVVMASSVPPSGLHGLTEGLRSLLRSGQSVRILSASENPAVVSARREMLDEYEEQLTKARAANAELSAKYKQTRDRAAQLASKLSTARVELDAIRENAARLERNDATEDLRARVAEAEQKAGRVETLESEKALLEGQVADLRGQLATASAQAAQARGAANELLARAESMRSQLDANGTQFQENQQEQERELERLRSAVEKRAVMDASLDEFDALRATCEQYRAEVEKAVEVRDQAMAEQEQVLDALDRANANRDQFRLASEQARIEVESLRNDLDGARSEQERLRGERNQAAVQVGEAYEARDRAIEDHEKARSEIEALAAERDELRTTLEQTRAAGRIVEEQVDELRAKAKTHEREMESLQHDAASQVAEANAHAGEAERRLGAVRDALDDARIAGGVVGVELQVLEEQFLAGAQSLARLVSQLAFTTDVPLENRVVKADEAEAVETRVGDTAPDGAGLAAPADADNIVALEEAGATSHETEKEADTPDGFVPLDPAQYALDEAAGHTIVTSQKAQEQPNRFAAPSLDDLELLSGEGERSA